MENIKKINFWSLKKQESYKKMLRIWIKSQIEAIYSLRQFIFTTSINFNPN